MRLFRQTTSSRLISHLSAFAHARLVLVGGCNNFTVSMFSHKDGRVGGGFLECSDWFMAIHVHSTSVRGHVKLQKSKPKWACECEIFNQGLLWFTMFYAGKWKFKCMLCMFSGIISTCEPALNAKNPHFLYIFYNILYRGSHFVYQTHAWPGG